jgi:hypothetical protein
MSVRLLFAVCWLLAAVPVAQAAEIILEGSITTNTTLTADNTYLLRGYVYVKNGATLTIQPGTVIRGEKATKGTLVITKAGFIVAAGTQEQPIVFTSNSPEGSRNVGDWGGLVVLGEAPTNCIGSCIIEGGLNNANGDGEFGGTIAEDSSGVIRYVRIEWAGIAIQPDNEINSLTLGGVGNRTVIDHVACGFGGDDGIEIFGGTVNLRYVVVFGSVDDDLDTDYGWQGNLQFGLCLRYPNRFDVSLSNGSESDNNKNGFLSSPFTAGGFSNVTFIGPRIPGQANPNLQFQAGANFKAATRLRVFNSVFVGWPKGVLLEGQSCENHALQNELRFRYNALADCPTPHELNLSGASPTLNIGQWFTDNQNTVYAGFAATGLVNPYAVQGTSLVPNATLTTGAAVANTADWTDAHLVANAGFFNEVSYRGGFGSTDWSLCWVNWNPQFTQIQNPVPCTNASPETTHLLQEVTFGPNPLRDRLEVVARVTAPGYAWLRVRDLAGRELLAQAYTVEPGKQLLPLNVEALPAGTYLLTLQAEGLQRSFRIVR